MWRGRELVGGTLEMRQLHYLDASFVNCNIRKLKSMEASLNNTQLEILNLFAEEQSEEDLREIKSLLLMYLAEKVVREADKSFDAHNLSENIFEQWKREHFRKAI